VESRLKMAEEFGATETRTSGEGITNADVVLECVGANESVQTALKCVRKGGAVTLVEPAQLPQPGTAAAILRY